MDEASVASLAVINECILRLCRDL